MPLELFLSPEKIQLFEENIPIKFFQMANRLENSEEILSKEEFKQATLGVHIYKNGVTFCIHPAHKDVSISYVETYQGAFSKEVILQYLKNFDDKLKNSHPDIQILATTFSFPGPIDNDVVEIPNWWATGDNHFSKRDFSNLSICQKQVNIINEIQALGHGLISTDEFYGLEDDFAPLWKPPAMDVMPTLYPLYFSSEAAAVLQIAFGLGAAFIVPIDSSDSYRVIASEWGHSQIQICGPEEAAYPEESGIVKFIRERKGAAVEWEDICSSRGLRNCYEYYLLHQQQNSPQTSVNQANSSNNNSLNTPLSTLTNSLNSNNNSNSTAINTIVDPLTEIEKDPNDPIASKALTMHFKFLMRFARQCSVSFKCKSVFIKYSVFNGGTQCIQKHIALCRDEFMHFTKSEWVSNVSVFVQTSNRNISSMGVMYHAFLGLARSENDETISISKLDQ
ncbi:hypothetical protein TRFO_27363 [Tritrichomonas foetus]|uniref:Uncharacterized protein n=1 Tax=Tritrichomonas foetus TaxID=1144522 RepID=A0A1J4K0M2_9EUKA|nr:hypothetical protein TRFO_27363 [Tritrichomonas foetus]|eukprot:OHT04985.1 hypothetical protein TRFO_27363 [Tritrichomonas foetus]